MSTETMASGGTEHRPTESGGPHAMLPSEKPARRRLERGPGGSGYNLCWLIRWLLLLYAWILVSVMSWSDGQDGNPPIGGLSHR